MPVRLPIRSVNLFLRSNMLRRVPSKASLLELVLVPLLELVLEFVVSMSLSIDYVDKTLIGFSDRTSERLVSHSIWIRRYSTDR